MSSNPQPSTLNSQLAAAIHSFTAWLDRVGYDSYDPYDLWGTRYGLFARRLYYQKNPLGLPLIAPIVAVETFCPGLRALFVRKQRFATADAQLLLAFLNLHSLGERDRLGCSNRRPADLAGGTGDSPLPAGDSPAAPENPQPLPGTARVPRAPAGVSPADIPLRHSKLEIRNSEFLARSRTLADDLLKLSIPGYSGHCWGYPFDWQNNRGLWHRNTPFITATPYCYEAFVKLAEATGESKYLDVAESAARFVFQDLNDTPVSSDGRASSVGTGSTPSQTQVATAGSYGPHDHTFVINASAYRTWLLFDAVRRFRRAGFPSAEYEKKAQANLNFILQSQRPDGSWLYALNSPAEAFIDHFHTCFVLKNLFKLNQDLESPAVENAIRNGYAYYRRELFDEDGLPKSFAIVPRTQLVRLEMYNFAEAITLGALLRDEIPAAFDDARRLAALLLDRYQCSAGHFVTRVFRGGWKHTVPFLRWPQAQLFYALTNLLHASEETHPRIGRDAFHSVPN